MKRLISVFVSAVALVVCATVAHAQDLLVPAGTLLQCTLDEPNFSSATAAVGDPVLCHLKTMTEFGKPVFPRGSMLGGHLEAAKEPGHFVGKGYLKITFDRVILPTGDLPVPAKVIQARGYKVDKDGDIDGRGHATRDVVEWMIPPLWPWKVVSLPFRGPRPTLKGEEPLQLRLMDDIVVPRNLVHPDRPPYAAGMARPSSSVGAPAPSAMQFAVERIETQSNTTATPVPVPEPVVKGNDVAGIPESRERYTTLMLKSNERLEVTRYRREGDFLKYEDVRGQQGLVNVDEIDWRLTWEMTAKVRSVDTVSRQVN
jgi:hypothetical protein